VNEYVRDFPEFRATVDVYAPPASTGGTSGDMVRVASNAIGLLMPVTDQQAAGFVGQAPYGLAGGRVEHLWIDGGTAGLGVGCEIRTTAGTFAVEGTADWKVARVALLSQVTPLYIGTAETTAGTINLIFNLPHNSHYIPFI
jgi:hypothetical protein